MTGPDSIDPPMAINVGSRSLTLTWLPPLQPNGIITAYRVYVNEELAEVVSSLCVSAALYFLRTSVAIFRLICCILA